MGIQADDQQMVNRPASPVNSGEVSTASVSTPVNDQLMADSAAFVFGWSSAVKCC